MRLFWSIVVMCLLLSCQSADAVETEVATTSTAINNEIQNIDKIQSMDTTIYDFKLTLLEGDTLDLATLKGKYVLCVNVASKCGFTGQYKELQALSEQYKDKLVVIGFPSNQFGSQEPGSADEIATFCERNYGVTFPIAEKADVKGDTRQLIYKWLQSEAKGTSAAQAPKWNFYKYLIGTDGHLIDSYMSITKPLSSKITKHLK